VFSFLPSIGFVRNLGTRKLKAMSTLKTVCATNSETYLSLENSFVFLVSCYQYLLVAIVFTVGPPYQEPIWNNGILFSSSTIYITHHLTHRPDKHTYSLPSDLSEGYARLGGHTDGRKILHIHSRSIRFCSELGLRKTPIPVSGHDCW
jgi:hypothetical protein